MDTTLILLARTTAIAAHAGQLDKGGQPYWRHPERVAGNVAQLARDAGFSLEERDETLLPVVAWLHDVLEDTNLTCVDLTDIGIPHRAILAVEALSRRDGEEYALFIERIKLDPAARMVKLADLGDNLDPGRRWQPGAAHRQRYLDARMALMP